MSRVTVSDLLQIAACHAICGWGVVVDFTLIQSGVNKTDLMEKIEN